MIRRSGPAIAQLLAWLLAFAVPSIASAAVHRVREGMDLQAAIDRAADGDTIAVGPGVFEATPLPYDDPLCGNCLEHRTAVRATSGFRIVGKGLVLIGAGPERTTLMTHAGYGVLFDDAGASSVRRLAVTGGRRDTDGNATDAAVVVRRSRVLLEDLHLRDNADRAPGVIVGIAGVAGREGAEIAVRRCRIQNNGWDGVALYRGATAEIADNVIEGGRGAGVGVTWDATATVLRNRVSQYWKGIGAFGASRVVARNNAVFDNLGWGIIATGDAFLEAANNVIVRNGNCGFAVWSETATGLAVNNVIVDNGWRREWVCPRVGIWHTGRLERFDVRFSTVHGNAEGQWKSETGEARPASVIDVDPVFREPDDFRVPIDSPVIDRGDPTRTDTDGSPSDMGLGGGPSAAPELGAPPERLPSERLRMGAPAWVKARARAARIPG